MGLGFAALMVEFFDVRVLEWGVVVAKSRVVMVHCVRPFGEKTNCNSIATRLKTTF